MLKFSKLSGVAAVARAQAGDTRNVNSFSCGPQPVHVSGGAPAITAANFCVVTRDISKCFDCAPGVRPNGRRSASAVSFGSEGDPREGCFNLHDVLRLRGGGTPRNGGRSRPDRHGNPDDSSDDESVRSRSPTVRKDSKPFEEETISGATVSTDGAMEIDETEFHPQRRRNGRFRSNANPEARPRPVAQRKSRKEVDLDRIIMIDRIQGQQFVGRDEKPFLCEVDRITRHLDADTTIGVKVLFMQRGGIKLICGSKEEADAILSSPNWGKDAFGGAIAHRPKANSSNDTGYSMDKKKLIIDNLGPSWTDEEILEELRHFEAVRVTRLKGSHQHHHPRLVEFASEEGAAKVANGKVYFSCKELSTRYPRTHRGPTHCTNCQELGHPATWCRNPTRCSDCAQLGHRRGDAICTRKDDANKVCHNCDNTSKPHPSGYKGCPAFVKLRREQHQADKTKMAKAKPPTPAPKRPPVSVAPASVAPASVASTSNGKSFSNVASQSAKPAPPKAQQPSKASTSAPAPAPTSKGLTASAFLADSTGQAAKQPKPAAPATSCQGNASPVMTESQVSDLLFNLVQCLVSIIVQCRSLGKNTDPTQMILSTFGDIFKKFDFSKINSKFEENENTQASAADAGNGRSRNARRRQNKKSRSN